MAGFFLKRKRKRLLNQPQPAHWESVLTRWFSFFPRLNPAERQKFLWYLQCFLTEKPFFGAQGFEVTEEMRMVIGGSAVRMVLHLDLDQLDAVKEIVVYESAFLPRQKEEVHLGEAHKFGTVVLAWSAVVQGLRNPCDGHDTALHEFAHMLDRAGGDFNGTPRLRASAHYSAWAKVMNRHFLALRHAEPRESHVLRSYGTKNEAEFFAVACEVFFERPQLLKDLLPDLYAELQRYFGFDPQESNLCERPNG